MAGFKIEYLVEYRGTGRLSRTMTSEFEFTTTYDWSKPKDLADFFMVLYTNLNMEVGQYELVSITKKVD